jgi:hypothetical protein
MFGRRILSLIATVVAASAQAPPELAEKTAKLEAIREQALAYSSHLPNFICTQVTRREIAIAPEALTGVKTSRNEPGSVRGLGQWQLSDTVEEQLTFFDRRENYKLLKLNGKLAAPGQSPPAGLASTGEFGTTLDSIFEPETQAQFEWKRWDNLRGRPVSVFTYRVEKSRSMSQLSTPSSHVTVAYHGLIYADRDTKTVLRLTTEAEAPPDFPLQDVTHILDYAVVSIAGERHVLPSFSEMQSRASEEFFKYGTSGRGTRQLLMRNRIDFRGYRKYTADAELKTDPEK